METIGIYSLFAELGEKGFCLECMAMFVTVWLQTMSFQLIANAENIVEAEVPMWRSFCGQKSPKPFSQFESL